jgi:UDP-N-acetylmuramoylalanine--D-glutamate ligase
MEEAVAEATRLCPQPGSVLLSPACASFDMYENYAARGEHFRRIVEGLT